MATRGAYKDCVRARVAIDVPTIPVTTPAAYHAASCDAQLHIGHARTVLLGSLIAQELGIPFHIRLDGAFRLGENLDAGILCCIATIISCLQIQCAKVYWQPAAGASPAEYERMFGEKGKRLQALAWAISDAMNEQLGVLSDDIIYHHPSVFIRGMEFADGFSGHSPGAGPEGTTARYLARERLFFETVDVEKCEINVPLIYDEGHKVSKSLGPKLNWNMFGEADGTALRSFLLATAIEPQDPLAALDTPFNLKSMTEEPFNWSWEFWEEHSQRKGRTR